MSLAAVLRDHWDEALLYRDLARLRTADDGVPIRQQRRRRAALGRRAARRVGGVLRGMGPRPAPVEAPSLARRGLSRSRSVWAVRCQDQSSLAPVIGVVVHVSRSVTRDRRSAPPTLVEEMTCRPSRRQDVAKIASVSLRPRSRAVGPGRQIGHHQSMVDALERLEDDPVPARQPAGRSLVVRARSNSSFAVGSDDAGWLTRRRYGSGTRAPPASSDQARACST